MKIIVGCAKCSRRYNAAGRRVGARFRCVCGESLTVASPRGHDASVVRCSSCGAPREGNAASCGHCHSDFTLRERDLHSVCPSCLARVSDKARYCHHCAAPLIADDVPNEKTEHICPACSKKKKLVSRRFGDFPISVLECPSCAGLWLGIESLEELLAAEARGNHPAVGYPTDAATDQSEKRKGYLPCVVCGDFMSRRHLARGKSGVVVDLCGLHGVWFDGHELAQLIAWIRTGGLEAVRSDLARMVGSKDEVRKRQILAKEKASTREKDSRQPPIPPPYRSLPTSDTDWIAILGSLAARMLTRRIIR